MTKEEIHNIYLHMSGKAEGIAEATGSADFPVLFANAILEYTKREWVGLTDDDIAQAMYKADAIFTGPMQFKFAKELEAKLRSKNDY